MNDDCDRHDQRAEGRYALEVPVSVRKRGSNQVPATLHDLSCGGCRLSGLYLPPTDDLDVFVRIPGLENLATRVCWEQGGKSGVTFERALHPAVFQRMISLHGQGAAPALAATYSGTAQPIEARREKPSGSRRDQIRAGYVIPDPTVLRDKQPLEGGKSILTLVRRNTARQSDHRGEPRYPAPETAELTAGTPERPVAIANISGSGIMISGQFDHDIGDTVQVRFAGCEPIWGTVIWQRGEQFGLSLPPGSIELEAA